jgi:hypothetical protein
VFFDLRCVGLQILAVNSNKGLSRPIAALKKTRKAAFIRALVTEITKSWNDDFSSLISVPLLLPIVCYPSACVYFLYSVGEQNNKNYKSFPSALDMGGLLARAQFVFRVKVNRV